MVVAARLAWLRSQVSAGTRTSIHITHDDSNHKSKVRFILGSSANCAASPPRLLIHTIDMMSSICAESVVVGRGHRFSGGRAEACFWLHAPRQDCAESRPPLQPLFGQWMVLDPARLPRALPPRKATPTGATNKKLRWLDQEMTTLKEDDCLPEVQEDADGQGPGETPSLDDPKYKKMRMDKDIDTNPPSSPQPSSTPAASSAMDLRLIVEKIAHAKLEQYWAVTQAKLLSVRDQLDPASFRALEREFVVSLAENKEYSDNEIRQLAVPLCACWTKVSQ